MKAKEKSPLSSEIDAFVKFMATIAVTTAIVFFGIGFTRNPSVSYNISFAIGVIVAFVPQGLPATVTTLLTIAAKRMATKNVLVKDLQGVETLGALTTLATDKTGTLTRNQMTVTNLWTNDTIYAAVVSSNLGVKFQVTDIGVGEILHISAICSRTRFDRTDVPIAERTAIGDATEVGLYKFAAANLENFDQVTNDPLNSFHILKLVLSVERHVSESF